MPQIPLVYNDFYVLTHGLTTLIGLATALHSNDPMITCFDSLRLVSNNPLYH